MISFSDYTQNNNCNLVIKNSLIFSLYNKNLKSKLLYYKINNSEKGFSKDLILNDNIYFASNGIKKNSIFRKSELMNNSNTKNFVSYFYNIEDNFSIFNIYPQKYFFNFIDQFLEEQNLIYNYCSKQHKNQKIKSVFFRNYVLFNQINNKSLQLNSKKQIFIKNYYNKCYYINNLGFIRRLDSRDFQMNF